MRKIIPIIDTLTSVDSLVSTAFPETLTAPTGKLNDIRERPLRDLRISVTDRCNFRCSYCMPKEIFGPNFPYKKHNSLLSFEEILRLSKIFVEHGVEKIRLTGGEPLLRKDIEVLIKMLSELKTLDGNPIDLTLTTNGSLLKRKAHDLRQAGLNRITVSLDALNDDIFRKMNDVDFPVNEVLEAITAASEAGFETIKVNVVVKKGVNDQEIIPLAKYFKGKNITLRFIEYMDVGNTNGWRMDDVLPSSEVIQLINSEIPIVPMDPSYAGEVAQRWAYEDGSGEIGVISSVTQAFCNSCSRARLSMEGKLYLCLFANSGYDLREHIRLNHSDLEISNVIRSIWEKRNDNYSELRGLASHLAQEQNKVEMSYIGG